MSIISERRGWAIVVASRTRRQVSPFRFCTAAPSCIDSSNLHASRMLAIADRERVLAIEDRETVLAIEDRAVGAGVGVTWAGRNLNLEFFLGGGWMAAENVQALGRVFRQGQNVFGRRNAEEDTDGETDGGTDEETDEEPEGPEERPAPPRVPRRRVVRGRRSRC